MLRLPTKACYLLRVPLNILRSERQMPRGKSTRRVFKGRRKTKKRHGGARGRKPYGPVRRRPVDESAAIKQQQEYMAEQIRISQLPAEERRKIELDALNHQRRYMAEQIRISQLPAEERRKIELDALNHQRRYMIELDALKHAKQN